MSPYQGTNGETESGEERKGPQPGFHSPLLPSSMRPLVSLAWWFLLEAELNPDAVNLPKAVS